jgi:hypothetical protein
VIASKFLKNQQVAHEARMQGRKIFPPCTQKSHGAGKETPQGERFFAPTKARELSVASKSNELI